MNDIKVLFKKIHEDAHVPTYKYESDSGCDLYTVEKLKIEPGEICKARTGICIELTKGIEAQIRPRSGLSLKGLTVVNSPATIDAGYRGELMVPLMNLGKETLEFEVGDRFAQMIFAPVYKGHFIEVKKFKNTDRNIGGFGSSGVH